MTPTKTEQLKTLLNEVLADDQGDVIGYLDDFLTTDNNAAVLIEILEAAENLLTKPEPENPESKAEYERTMEEAFHKWNGGE